MKANVLNNGDISVIELQGKITIGEGDVKLRNLIKDQLAEGRKKLVLDLKQVSYMDSSGIGELVGTFTTVKNSGGELKLANLTSKIKDIMQLTALITVFEVFDSVEDAVNSF
jgi:anti-sigma B factor antagonist